MHGLLLNWNLGHIINIVDISCIGSVYFRFESLKVFLWFHL